MSINEITGPGVSSLTIDGSNLTRFLPEPTGSFGNFMQGLIKTVTSAVKGGADSLLGQIDPKYQAFIEAQLHAQEQLQLVSLYSNIEKSKHETKMVAIRNVRVG